MHVNINSIGGGIVMAANVVATECVPSTVWVSGKYFVSLGLYYIVGGHVPQILIQ